MLFPFQVILIVNLFGHVLIFKIVDKDIFQNYMKKITYMIYHNLPDLTMSRSNNEKNQLLVEIAVGRKSIL